MSKSTSSKARSKTVQGTEDADALRSEILDLVEKYHDLAYPVETFVPGESPALVSGRVFGASDMRSLVSSALDFWLTTGRFNDEFQKRLAKILGARHVLTVNSGSSGWHPRIS